MCHVTADDAPNATQWQAWNGPMGAFWADNADRFDRGVPAYRAAFEQAAAVESDDQVLDIGCGAGQSTRNAARRAHRGHAYGVDLSARLLEVARRRAADEQIGNVTFTQADAQTHPFTPAGVDIAISHLGSMFFSDPLAAFTNVRSALRPGGRLVLLVWQSLRKNEFIHRVLDALTPGRETPLPPAQGPSPLSLADPERVHALLEHTGFADVELVSVESPINLGADPDDALVFQSGQHAGLLADLDADTRARALNLLHDDLVAHYVPHRGVFYRSAAWIVRARNG